MKIIKPGSSGYVTFGCIAGIPMLIGIIAAFKSISALWIIAICVLGMICAWIWIAGYEIRINEGEVVFKSLLGGLRSIKIADIKEAKISAFSCEKQKEIFGPPIQLRITPRSETFQSISIDAKVFKRKDLNAVVDLLNRSTSSN
jgi:hypothetical protein